jgi:hypothetical protein
MLQLNMTPSTAVSRLSRSSSLFSTGTVRVVVKRNPDVFDAMLASCQDAGWDGDDAVPITEATVRVARRIHDHLLSYNRVLKPHIAPGADGTIGFELHTLGGAIRKVFIEARPDECVRAYWVSSDNRFEKIAPTGANLALDRLSNVLWAFAKETEAFE